MFFLYFVNITHRFVMFSVAVYIYRLDGDKTNLQEEKKIEWSTENFRKAINLH